LESVISIQKFGAVPTETGVPDITMVVVLSANQEGLWLCCVIEYGPVPPETVGVKVQAVPVTGATVGTSKSITSSVRLIDAGVVVPFEPVTEMVTE
jgi:hypothetical protein